MTTRKSLQFEDFTLDLCRLRLQGRFGPVELRRKSFEVLRYLVEHAGRVVTKEEMINAVWPDVTVGDESLTQCISEVRHALGDDNQRIIKTVPRRGYLIDVAISVGDVPVAKVMGEINSAPRLPLPDRPSIAVLAFSNMSGDPEQEYFADGITEDIITALSRLHWFFVIARTSTFGYKGRGVDVRQIGCDLGARYILEGSVRKSGQRVRISSQLLDAITGNHIWSERYDRDLTDIFTVQDDITASVTAAIEPKLLAAEGLRAQMRSTNDLDAWDLVTRALSHFWRLTPAEIETAIGILRQAVERYPNYAPAHSMLAFAILASVHRRELTESDRQLAAQVAFRATELDDTDPWTHMALGYVAFVDRNTNEAVRHFYAALDLNPNFAIAVSSVGFALALDGQSEDAIRWFEQALRMSPRDPSTSFFFSAISAAHYLAERYGEAVEWAQKAVRTEPRNLGGHRILCASLAQAGEIEAAAAVMCALRRLQPNISAAWIKRSVPFTAKPMAHVLEGLRRAGLPDD
jgi:adenylate cyclase